MQTPPYSLPRRIPILSLALAALCAALGCSKPKPATPPPSTTRTNVKKAAETPTAATKVDAVRPPRVQEPCPETHLRVGKGCHQVPATVLAEDKRCTASGRGCFAIGWRLLEGLGVQRSDKAALARFARGCSTGRDDLACLAQAWLDARGGDAQAKARIATLQPALVQSCRDEGAVLTCYALSHLHARGMAAEPAQREAVGEAAWKGLEASCSKSAQPGDCFRAARLVDKGTPRGRKARDLAKARDLYQRACDLGDDDGCGALAHYMTYGDRKKAMGAFQPSQGVELLDKLCQGGNAHACRRAGMLLHQPPKGLKADATRAGALLQRACTMGDGDACALATR